MLFFKITSLFSKNSINRKSLKFSFCLRVFRLSSLTKVESDFHFFKLVSLDNFHHSYLTNTNKYSYKHISCYTTKSIFSIDMNKIICTYLPPWVYLTFFRF
jgi:hypothetical protein